MTLNDAQNPFKIKNDINVNNLENRGKGKGSVRIDFLVESLKKLPIDNNQSVEIDHKIVKGRSTAAYLITQSIKRLKAEEDYKEHEFTSRSIRNPTTKEYEGMRIFRTK